MKRFGGSFGRHVFGVACVAFGVITLTWHEYNGWHLLRDIWRGQTGIAWVYLVAAAQIFGGMAIQFRRTTRWGAIALAIVFGYFASVWVHRIIAMPRTYDSWGNFFEQFSLVVGAALVYGSMSARWKANDVTRIGRILFGICVVSFTIEQTIHLDATAGLVPKWMPPSQMFWAIATSVALALAAAALLANRAALLAARLLTAMLVGFGVLVWVRSSCGIRITMRVGAKRSRRSRSRARRGSLPTYCYFYDLHEGFAARKIERMFDEKENDRLASGCGIQTAGHSLAECSTMFGFHIDAWYKAINRGVVPRVAPTALRGQRLRYDWEAIQRYYDEGHTYRDCRAHFGFHAQSWAAAVRSGRLVANGRRWPLTKILEKSRCRGVIKRRLLECGILTNRCEHCGLTEWMGRGLCIQIDHRNGVPDDHRIENLRMLCPNCHSQTETFGGRNVRRNRVIKATITTD